MKKFLFTILLLSLFPIGIYAAEDIPTSSLYAQSDVDQLNQIEIERQKALEEQVGFTLPKYTDNPSYVITFKDPSPDQKGVEIQVDGKDFTKISSPYTFTALTIGSHTIKFRFNDKDGNVQTLDYTLIVIPRSPIINPPSVEKNSINLKGTGLSNSDIVIFISSNTFNYTETVQTDFNGEWSTVIKPEGGLSEGIYTTTAYVKKNGYSSDLAKATVFEVGGKQTNNEVTDKRGIYFAFKDIDPRNILNILTTNPDLMILIAVSILLGAIPAFLLTNGIKKHKDDRFFKAVEKDIKGDKKEEEKTLRELFESSKNNNEKERNVIDKDTPTEEKKELRINTDVSNKIESRERVISKEDFLKEYKAIDPDESTGKEKPSRKVNKEIKVSLTSREE